MEATSKHAGKHEARPPQVNREREGKEGGKEESSVSVCAGVSNMDGYKGNGRCILNFCYKLNAI